MERLLEEAQRVTGLEGDEALFAYWVLVGKEYVARIQGTNSREDTIDSAIEALEENMHNYYGEYTTISG